MAPSLDHEENRVHLQEASDTGLIGFTGPDLSLENPWVKVWLGWMAILSMAGVSKTADIDRYIELQVWNSWFLSSFVFFYTITVEIWIKVILSFILAFGNFDKFLTFRLQFIIWNFFSLLPWYCSRIWISRSRIP